VIVKLHNFIQATLFIKVIYGELARVMVNKATDLAFKDPMQAFVDSTKKPWSPSRVSNILRTFSKEITEYNPKRSRTNTGQTIST
jgi:hypothetical protein